METEAKGARARQLLERLYEHLAAAELAAVAILAGGTRVVSNPELPWMCHEYVRLVSGSQSAVPTAVVADKGSGSQSAVLKFLSAHRQLVQALCRMRDAGLTLETSDDLDAARRLHSQQTLALARLLRP